MAKAEPVTWNFIRYRLTDPVSGVDNWRAEAFGLLVAERFYPDLVLCCQDTKSEAYGIFRHHLNRVWAALQDPAVRDRRQENEREIARIADHIPDNRHDGALGARAVAAGTICMHLARFAHSGDRDDIARLALAAYAGVFEDKRDASTDGQATWAASIPFDEVGAYDAIISDAPGVQSELRLQNADLSFVETLNGSIAQRSTAVLRRAFASQTLPQV